MRGQHAVGTAMRANRGKQRLRIGGEDGQRVGVEHGAAFRAARIARTLSRVSAPIPAPGPISAALRRGSASKRPEGVDRSPTGWTMTPVSAAA